VIDGAETGVDYVYMHLLEPPLVRTGERVLTGQRIGEVGETGSFWREPRGRPRDGAVH
jgi:murein DD-endopeptidase MepM/ murein hydrolase activator NlpD